jgi:hypothetical protein
VAGISFYVDKGFSWIFRGKIYHMYQLSVGMFGLKVEEQK